MKLVPLLLCGLAALVFTGCAGGRPAQGLTGHWSRTFFYDEDDHRAQVTEDWHFTGVSATSHAVWHGASRGVPYQTVADQTWSMRYRGRGLFEIEETGRRLTGAPLPELTDSYEMEIDGAEVSVDGGPSDAPLRPALGRVVGTTTSSVREEATTTAPKRKSATKASATKRKKRR